MTSINTRQRRLVYHDPPPRRPLFRLRRTATVPMDLRAVRYVRMEMPARRMALDTTEDRCAPLLVIRATMDFALSS